MLIIYNHYGFVAAGEVSTLNKEYNIHLFAEKPLFEWFSHVSECVGELSTIFRISLLGRLSRLANFLYVPHLPMLVTFGSSEVTAMTTVTSVTNKICSFILSTHQVYIS